MGGAQFIVAVLTDKQIECDGEFVKLTIGLDQLIAGNVIAQSYGRQ